jgi:DNA polymerase-3 subunit epsilon
MSRGIVLDTETTGLNATGGDRIIEIGCVEVMHGIRTNNTFQCYINPERESSPGALRVHGLSREFLSDKPKFADIADNFLEFIGDASLIIHNANFDLGFLNHELGKIHIDRLSNNIIDTLLLAKKKFPGAKVNLDALCKKFNIDSSKRVKHGALLDAELLADVYLELIGGSQTKLNLNTNKKEESNTPKIKVKPQTIIFEHRNFDLTEEEQQAHQEMLKKISGNLWTS